MASKFRNTGQTCVTTNRIFVQVYLTYCIPVNIELFTILEMKNHVTYIYFQDGIYNEFVSKLKNEVETTLVLGNGINAGVNQV